MWYNDYHQLHCSVDYGIMVNFCLQFLNWAFQLLHWLRYLLNSEALVDFSRFLRSHSSCWSYLANESELARFEGWLENCELWRNFAFFRFKYFISQPGIIHWINVWAAPFGKRLAVRTYPVFLLERRSFMLGATVLAIWLALRQRFLQRETLVGSGCCRWARLEEILSLVVWMETLLQGSAAAGTGPEWSKQVWETLLISTFPYLLQWSDPEPARLLCP